MAELKVRSFNSDTRGAAGPEWLPQVFPLAPPLDTISGGAVYKPQATGARADTRTGRDTEAAGDERTCNKSKSRATRSVGALTFLVHPMPSFTDPDPSDPMHLCENTEILRKGFAKVINEVERMETNKHVICENLRGTCGVYSANACYNKYLGNLKMLRKRLKRPLVLPPHSIELKDDTKQLVADVGQVFKFGLRHAHEVCFPRVQDQCGGAPPDDDGAPTPVQERSRRSPKAKRQAHAWGVGAKKRLYKTPTHHCDSPGRG